MKPLTLRYAGVLPIVVAVLLVGATFEAVPVFGAGSPHGAVVSSLLAESSVDATEIEELIAVDSTTGEIVPYVQYFAEDAVLPEFVPFGSSRTQPGIDVVWGGYLGGPTGADLLLYDRDSGWFEFRSVGQDGQTVPFFSAFGTRGWSHVVPGDYNGDGIADLLFYRAADGLMRFLDGFSSLTLAAWVRPDVVSSPWDHARIIVSKYDTQVADSISYWLLLRDDEVEIFVSGKRVVNEDRLGSTGVDLVPGQWAHVAGTWDGTHLVLYVNGVQVASKTTSVAVMDDSDLQVDIGAAEKVLGYGGRAGFFDGLLDEVYIYDRALNASEMAVLAGR